MAARLTSSLSQFYSLASALFTSYPFTICGWFKPITLTTRQTIFSIGNSSNSNKIAINWDGTGTPKALRLNISGSSSDSFNGTVGFTTSAWHHFVLRMTSATVREILLDGGNKTGGSATSIAVPTGLNRTRLGEQADSTGGSFADMALEHIGAYSTAVPDDMCLQLATPGCDCQDIESASLVTLWELLTADDIADAVGSKSLTANASPTADTGGAPIGWVRTSYLILTPSTAAIAATGNIASADAAAVTGLASVAATGDVADPSTAGATGIASIAATGAIVDPSAANVTIVAFSNDADATGNIADPSTASVTGTATIVATDADGVIVASGNIAIPSTANVTAPVPAGTFTASAPVVAPSSSSVVGVAPIAASGSVANPSHAAVTAGATPAVHALDLGSIPAASPVVASVRASVGIRASVRATSGITASKAAAEEIRATVAAL